MASERELRTHQEQLLFNILMVRKLVGENNMDALENYLSMTCENAQNGMSADEVDAVRARVERAKYK